MAFTEREEIIFHLCSSSAVDLLRHSAEATAERLICGPSNCEHILTRLLRALVYLMFNYPSRKTWICVVLQATFNVYKQEGWCYRGGLLPIASVVIYSHFAVFFMAVTAVIIIVIYIHHSSFSLAVLVYRTRQSPFAVLCVVEPVDVV